MPLMSICTSEDFLKNYLNTSNKSSGSESLGVHFDVPTVQCNSTQTCVLRAILGGKSVPERWTYWCTEDRKYPHLAETVWHFEWTHMKVTDDVRDFRRDKRCWQRLWTRLIFNSLFTSCQNYSSQLFLHIYTVEHVKQYVTTSSKHLLEITAHSVTSCHSRHGHPSHDHPIQINSTTRISVMNTHRINQL